MNKQELQELNKKLAEWRGFKWWSIHRQGDLTDDARWEPLCGVEILMNDNKGDMPYLRILKDSKWESAPDFTQSLDACFKWLVPEIKVQFHDVALEFEEGACRIYVYGRLRAEGNDKPDALALCLAIERLIENEKH